MKQNTPPALPEAPTAEPTPRPEPPPRPDGAIDARRDLVTAFDVMYRELSQRRDLHGVTSDTRAQIAARLVTAAEIRAARVGR